MFHFGDIMKIDGHKVPIVDVITGGSPCQDLSVAGKRAGLAGERSGLFMEQMRIVKEMRDESRSQLIAKYGENFDRTKISPRYLVWENVCFIADTIIDCEDGQKKICDVKIGDKVKTHLGRYMPVVETYIREHKEVITIHHFGPGESFTCTPNHPIYGCRVDVDGSCGEPEYIPAGELNSKSRIAQFMGNEIVYTAIKSIEFTYKKETVYNLSVLEDNTYVANGIICHNCGAFSSGEPSGADFAAVLEEIVRVVIPEAPSISIPEDGWSYAGNLEGVAEDNTPISVCWRVHDAQYWGKSVIDDSGRVVKRGTPQRRRRIALVADFGGNTAPEILFERTSMSGNTEQSGEARQGTSGTTGESIKKSGTTGFHLTQDPVSSVEKSYAVSCGSSTHGQCVNGVLACGDVISDPVQKTYKKDAHAKTSEDGQGWVETDVNDTLNAFDNGETRTPTLVCEDKPSTIAIEGNGCGNNTPMVFENHGQDTRYNELGDVCTTVSATFGMGGNNTPFVVEDQPSTIAIEGNGTRDSHKGDGYSESDVMYTLNTVEQHAVCVKEPILLESNQNHATIQADGVSTSLPASMGEGGGYVPMVVDKNEPVMMGSIQSNAMISKDGVSSTLMAGSGDGGGNIPMIVDESDSQIKQEGCDVYNQEITGEVSATVTSACGGSNTSGPKVLMHGLDAYNQVSTGEVAKPLTNAATDADHIPCVYGFEPGVAQRLDPENRFSEEIAPTLRAKMGDNQAAVVYGIDQQGGKGQAAYSENVAPTMAADSHGTPHAVCYGMSALDSNAMKSSNPHSGIYEADTSRTLDLNGGNPACNQGGMMVVQPNSGLSDSEKEQIEEWVDAVNSSAKHQQDLIQSDLGVARTIACGTHASGPHLTKTLVTSNVTDKPNAVCTPAPTSDKSVEGVDVYNFATTGEVGRTIATAGGGLNEHIPCVIEGADKPIKESVKTYGVTTKGNGDAFIAEERHTSLSTGGGEAGQGYPCILTEQQEPEGCLNPWEHQGKHIQSENGVAETLYAGESRYGGGEAYVFQTNTYQDTTGALCAAGYSKLGTQEASNDMYVVQEPTSWDGSQVSSTLTANNANGSQRMPDKDHFNAVIQSQVQCMEVFHCTTENEVAHPIKARDYKDPQVVAVDMGGGKSGCGISEEQAPTLTTTHGGEPVVFGFKPDQGSKAKGMGFEEEKAPTLSTCNNAGVLSIENHPNDSRIKVRDDGTVQTLSGRMGTGGNNTPMVMETDVQAFTQNQREEVRDLGDKSGSVTSESGMHQQTYVSKPVVRRLTPLECTRLQGFPDFWVDIGDWVDSKGKKHKDADSPKYKALGNSIALPFWDWMAGRMCDQLRKSGVEQPTMASLFDGISGFPLVYAKHGCTPKWSSEIEEFPIAVCKKHFGDEATGEVGDYEQYLKQMTELSYIPNRYNVIYGLDRASFNQGPNAKYDFSVEEDKAQTLVSRGPGGVMTEGAIEDNDRTVGSICASDYKGIRNQDIGDGKYVIDNPST